MELKKTHIVPESCDYNAALVKEMPFTPADSCFEIDATGTITAWNIEGTLTMEYGGYVYTPSQPNTCYVRNLSIPSTINGITVKTIGSPTSVENIKKSIFFCKKS